MEGMISVLLLNGAINRVAKKQTKKQNNQQSWLNRDWKSHLESGSVQNVKF